VQVDLSVKLGPLKLKNPILTASGCFGYGLEFEKVLDLNELGGFVTKGISLLPRKGNKTTRIAETYGGMLNSIGLQNVGLEVFIKEKLPALKKYNTAVIVNIFGEFEEEYYKLAQALNPCDGITALEANISCPNVKKGGIQFGTDPDSVYNLTKGLKNASRFPIIMKLTPNVTDIRTVAKAAVEGGADILSVINTLRGMAVDLENKKPVLSTIYGGLSGPCIKPIALAMVHQVLKVVKIPVIGIGGIMDEKDALEFMLLGASAVQVGTANFVKTDASIDILTGIRSYLESRGIKKVTDFIGSIS
jgi:dihydroorotate dehydrogenase (NAD+) catalytic subunit